MTHCGKWEKLCCPTEDGGLKFLDLGSFNRALLAIQCWGVIREPSSLVGRVPSSLIGRVLKVSYFKISNFLEAKAGFYPSYIW